MIVPAQIPNPYVKPRWQAPVGVMESVVAYNCRKYGMPHPVLAMPMWERAGNRVIDCSGKWNHGTFTNTPEWVAEGINFPGTDDYIVVNYDPSLDFPNGTNITISLWFKTTSTKNYNGLLSKYDIDASPYEGYALLLNAGTQDNKVTFIPGTYPAEVKTPLTYSDGVFHHVVATVNGSVVTIYMDGIAVVSESHSVNLLGNLTNNLYIGSQNYDPAAREFAGIINNPAIWGVALTAAQVKFLHDNPYFMYRLPEELYGYTSAAPPPVSIPVFLHHYNQMRQ